MRSPNDEGSQFSKFHFACNKEERLVLNSFFREYNLYLKKKTTLNLLKVAYHPVSCLLHLYTLGVYPLANMFLNFDILTRSPTLNLLLFSFDSSTYTAFL